MSKLTIFSFTFLLCYVSLVEAMFFTNSKDNDYPRIGKRPVPASVYKTWLSRNEQIEYLPYNYETEQDRNDVEDRRERSYQWTKDFDDVKQSTKGSVQVTGEILDRNLYRMLMSYLDSDDDLIF